MIAFKGNIAEHTVFIGIEHYGPEVIDGFIVQNNPVNFVDPEGLFSLSSLKPTKSTVRSAVKFGTAFGYGALATTLTGNPAIGVTTFWFVNSTMSMQTNDPVSLPGNYSGTLEIINPPSLNDYNSVNGVITGTDCDSSQK